MPRLMTVLALVGAIAAPAGAQTQSDTFVSITAGSIQRGGFIPRTTPYTQGGPAVSVYLFDQRNVRTSDGLVITGFEFIGWAEGDGTRVLVFALVPQKGAPNTYMPDGKAESLERRDFATYRILHDQGVAVVEMRDLGVEPMILHAGPVPAQVAQFERFRVVAEQLRAAGMTAATINIQK
jgi:hypothetical protein